MQSFLASMIESGYYSFMDAEIRERFERIEAELQEARAAQKTLAVLAQEIKDKLTEVMWIASQTGTGSVS